MPATAGEKLLLAELQALAAGQADGSFGPAQALAMLAGFLKLRDRVDTLTESCTTFAGIDAAVRLAELEQHDVDADQTTAAIQTLAAELEQRIATLEARVTALEDPPPAP